MHDARSHRRHVLQVHLGLLGVEATIVHGPGSHLAIRYAANPISEPSLGSFARLHDLGEQRRAGVRLQRIGAHLDRDGEEVAHAQFRLTGDEPRLPCRELRVREPAHRVVVDDGVNPCLSIRRSKVRLGEAWEGLAQRIRQWRHFGSR
ncbi:hypothetical protein ALQ73_200247 [Pseudomonas savastanoi pv. glycinea]|uniref:Uncharacterized protein n=1 Tax=Pseudomonas savastanoi pv. glycinea TaxID=318 RepID=A0A3M3FWL6_PSESG|nr:hypothetical protein ALQ73_200247 [Pseudomonas savastanoi pv. glycinea]